MAQVLKAIADAVIRLGPGRPYSPRDEQGRRTLFRDRIGNAYVQARATNAQHAADVGGRIDLGQLDPKFAGRFVQVRPVLTPFDAANPTVVVWDALELRFTNLRELPVSEAEQAGEWEGEARPTVTPGFYSVDGKRLDTYRSGRDASLAALRELTEVEDW